MRRWLLVLLAVPLLAWAAFCALMYSKQKDLRYFPELTRVAAADTDVSLARGDVTLRGWRVNPGHDDVLLFFGGNGESVQNIRDALSIWLPRAISLLLA